MTYYTTLSYMGGCQNYGPFWVPWYKTAPSVLGRGETTWLFPEVGGPLRNKSPTTWALYLGP